MVVFLTVLGHQKPVGIGLVVHRSFVVQRTVGGSIHDGVHLIVEPHEASGVRFIALSPLERAVKVLEVLVLGVTLLPVAFDALLHQPVGDLDEDVSLSGRALQLLADALVGPHLDQRSHLLVAPVSTGVGHGDHVELFGAGRVCEV